MVIKVPEDIKIFQLRYEPIAENRFAIPRKLEQQWRDKHRTAPSLLQFRSLHGGDQDTHPDIWAALACW